MELRKKTAIIVGVTLIGLVLVLFILSEVIVIGAFANLEKKGAEDTMSRVVTALSNDLLLMNTMAGEWTTKESVQKFLSGPHDPAANPLLDNSTFERMQFNIILFFDPSGTIIDGKMYDLSTHREVPLPESLLVYITPKNKLYERSDTHGLTGILRLPDGPMLITMRGVHANGNQGAMLGSVLMGRYIDQQVLQHISLLTNIPVEIFETDNPNNPRNIIAAKTQIPEGESYFLKRVSEDIFEVNAPQYSLPLNDTFIATYARVNDIFDSPAFIMRVIVIRDIYSQGRLTTNYFIMLLFAACLLYGVVILLLIENTTLSRITQLSSEVSGVAVADDFSMRVTPGGDDEIGHLARSINWMLQQLEGTYAQLKNCFIRSEDRYQILFEKSSDLVVIFSLSDWDNYESIMEVNDAACKRLGYTRDEVLRLPLRSVFAEDAQNTIARMKEQCVKIGEFSFETIVISKFEEKIPVKIYAHILHERENPAVIMICQEIARH